MSVGPMGMIGSIAGTPLSQTKSSDVERTQQESTNQARQAQAEQKAESAAGVGETEQDQEASDRDADGHRLWEAPPEAKSSAEGDESADSPLSRDPSGTSGANLDLSG